MANEKKNLTPEEKQALDAARIERKQALAVHIKALRKVLIVSASAVLTLWSASKGMLSLLYGLDAVAEVRETRGYVQRRLLCVLYTVGMLLALLLVLLLSGNKRTHNDETDDSDAPS